MRKVIFVTGGKGAGKSTYIARNYEGKESYHIFDLALLNKRLFGDYDSFLSDVDRQLTVWNETTGDCLDAFIDGSDLVLELSLEVGFDEEIIRIVSTCKEYGVPTEWVQLTCEPNESKRRVEKALKFGNYFSSVNYLEDTLIVFSEILESIRLTNELGFMESIKV